MAALDFLSCANCLCMQIMARVWLLDLRLQIEAFCASRPSVLLWQVRWSYPSHSSCWVLSFGCSCVLADFKFGIFHSRDCYKVFGSDVKDNWDEVACCQIKGGQRNAILTGPLYSRNKSQRRNGHSDDKVLTIALRYTAASVFRTGDSLTQFRDSISAFQCRSARLTASRSFGYLSWWGHADTRFR
jgi:hypothetical protein